MKSKFQRKDQSSPFTLLPFVVDRKVGNKTVRCWWEVEPTQDLIEAGNIGSQYAEAYVRHLVSDNNFRAGSGMTHHLIADMVNAAQRGGPDVSRFYAIGFFSVLEEYIAAGYHAISAAPQNEMKRTA